MSEEYLKYKYTDTYFDNNYSNTDNTIRRRDISNNENQFEKGRCLRACLKHFANIDVTTITDLNQHFVCNGNSTIVERRCCCSQHEEMGLNASVITHKATGLSFVIGKVCFKNLFDNVPPEQFHKFYNRFCDFCEQKIKVYNKNRPNFCNLKCVKKHNEQEERKKEELRIKKWEEEAPIREAARLKKWEEEAPIREAQAKQLKHALECIKEQEHIDWKEKNLRYMEQNQKYIESQQSKNKKPVYTQCQDCKKPKVGENHQKWPLCYKCNEKKKSLDNGF